MNGMKHAAFSIGILQLTNHTYGSLKKGKAQHYAN